LNSAQIPENPDFMRVSGILFLSREGGFFLKAWEKLGFQACLKAFHLECSRESLGRALEEEDQGEAFFRYLKGFGLQGRVVLADLGWGGTMQRMRPGEWIYPFLACIWDFRNPPQGRREALRFLPEASFSTPSRPRPAREAGIFIPRRLPLSGFSRVSFWK